MMGRLENSSGVDEQRMLPASPNLRIPRVRTHKTLVKWNDERGFGFIQPSIGTEKLFIHISALPRDGTRPARLGAMVSFEFYLRKGGKKRAVRPVCPGSGTRTSHRPARWKPTATRQRSICTYQNSPRTVHRVAISEQPFRLQKAEKSLAD